MQSPPSKPQVARTDAPIARDGVHGGPGADSAHRGHQRDGRASRDRTGRSRRGQVLDLDLALENGQRVRVTAKVVRIQHPQWGRVGGVGVQFIRFEGESLSILEQFLETSPTPAA